MSTEIPYLDKVINPTAGCSPISRGCQRCFALRDAWRLSHNPHPKIAAKYKDVVTKNDAGGLQWTGQINHTVDPPFAPPYRWKRSRYRVGVGFNSDIFHSGVEDSSLAGMIAAAAFYKRHDFFFLTKRPRRVIFILDDLRDDYQLDLSKHTNVLFGVSIESEQYCWRFLELIQAKAARYWISLEPLIGDPQFLEELLLTSKVSWVVLGGENGKNVFPLSANPVRLVRDLCKKHNVPFYFKGWGAHVPQDQILGPCRWALDGRYYLDFPPKAPLEEQT